MCTHSYRVANAASPSADPGPAQNRRRDRRTYQLDRSSMNAAIRRPAAAASNASIAAVTSPISVCSPASAHRSSSGRSAAGGASATRPGCQAAPGPAAAARAYSTRNAAVLQKVSSTLRAISASTGSLIFLATHGDPLTRKNQRRASAPQRSIRPIGSITLPRRVLILRPDASVIRPRHSTSSYADRPVTSVPTAISA